MGDQLFGRPVILRRRQLRISASAVASRWSAYGERHRCGETSSTSFVESAVNQVVAKRMVKKQQMRLVPAGRPSVPAGPRPGPQRRPGR